MSMRTQPPKGRPPQRPQQSTARTARPAEPPKRKRGRGVDIIVLLAVAALVIFLVKTLTDSVTAGSPGASAQPGASGSAAAAGAPASGNLPIISEIMPSNKGTITAEDGKYYDWIEIYNPTKAAINLAGFALSDNLKKPDKFVFPTYKLDPGQFAIVFASGGEPGGKDELHAPFKMGSAGEMLVLSDPDGREVQRVTFPSVEPNASYACDMSNTKKWAVNEKPTPGFPNTNEGYAAYCETRYAKESVTLMDEVMADNVVSFKDGDGDFSDFVELYNGTDKAIDLTGMGLSNKEDEPKRWEFPAMKLEPKKYLVVYLSGKNRAEAGKELHTDFRLNAFQDVLLLSDKRGLIVQKIEISKMEDDTSFGLVPGTTQWKTFVHPTPGEANTEEGFNALQPKLYGKDLSDLIISEVMPVDSDKLKDQFDEYPGWIELYNRSGKTINLKGYALTDKADELGRWVLPDMQLEAGQYLTVFASGRNLTDEDAVSKKKLHADFGLSSGGETLVLTTPDGKVADRCLVPAMQSGVSYARPEGKTEFKYLTNPTPNAANPDGYPGYAPDPVFSLKAGQYAGAQQVTLATGDSQTKIHYTTDCTTPKENSATYSGPINVTKSTVIRAVAYRDGYLPSSAVCSTYLIDEKIDLPIVSIVTDPDNLFDEQTGIYANGPGWTPTFPHTGANFWKDWERPAHVEVIEPDGTVGISQGTGLKIYGQYSRGNDQKSFSLIARNEYGKNSFDYPLFPDKPFTSYKSFIVRNSAQDANMSRIRTALQLGLAAETSDLDIQASRQGIVFVNGQFWGVYDIMEKINEHFLAQNGGADPNKVDLLEGNASVKTGSNKDYKDLIEYVKSHDLSVQKNYDYVASKIDIDNYIDWCCIEIYTVNSDLGNVRFWKPETPDGKWRWILYDMDWGFYFLNQADYASYKDSFSKFLDPKGNGVQHMFDNSLIRGLLKNPEFKQKFIERFVYHCTVTFESSRVLARIDELAKAIEPYMARDKAKWDQGTVAKWQKQVDLLRDFAKQRPEMNLHYMQQYFHLSDAEMAKLTKK